MSDREYDAILNAIRTAGLRSVVGFFASLIALGAGFGVWLAKIESRVQSLEDSGASYKYALEKIIDKLDVSTERLSRIEGKLSQ